MKNTSLALFAALILLGWTALATGVIAVFAGAPEVTSKAHSHGPQPVVTEEPALFSDSKPCPAVPEPVDASVPCSA
jgi:hypothetical protein